MVLLLPQTPGCELFILRQTFGRAGREGEVETGFLCAALAVLELALRQGWPLNDLPTCAS